MKTKLTLIVLSFLLITVISLYFFKLPPFSGQSIDNVQSDGGQTPEQQLQGFKLPEGYH